MSASKIAIVGGGIAGLACARVLAERGHAVTVFDKGRKAGGRLSTRRFEGLAFDHGAQYFTARDPDFVAQLDQLVAAGHVQPWRGTITVLGEGALWCETIAARDRFVGVPGMSGVARGLAEDLHVVAQTRVAAVAFRRRKGEGPWRLRSVDGDDLGGFDRVVIAVPSGQAVDLLASAPGLAEAAASCRMSKCLVAMMGVARPLPLEWDGAFVQGRAVSWIGRNSSKPDRPRPPGPECWVVHGSPGWSEANFDAPPEEFAETLKREFTELSGLETLRVTHLVGHRWGYAEVPAPLPERFLYDAALGIGACGDWCGGARVEGAWCSGHALGERIASELDTAVEAGATVVSTELGL